MKVYNEEFNKKLEEWLKPQQKPGFGSMIASMSWFARKRKEFIKLIQEKGELE
jgi:hypothetical protein